MQATLRSSLRPSLEESGPRSRRERPAAAFWRVTAPLVRPGAAAAIVLVFAFSLGDLATSQVLLPLANDYIGSERSSRRTPRRSPSRRRRRSPRGKSLIVLAIGAAYVLMSRFGEVRELG